MGGLFPHFTVIIRLQQVNILNEIIQEILQLTIKSFQQVTLQFLQRFALTSDERDKYLRSFCAHENVVCTIINH